MLPLRTTSAGCIRTALAFRRIMPRRSPGIKSQPPRETVLQKKDWPRSTSKLRPRGNKTGERPVCPDVFDVFPMFSVWPDVFYVPMFSRGRPKSLTVDDVIPNRAKGPVRNLLFSPSTGREALDHPRLQ